MIQCNENEHILYYFYSKRHLQNTKGKHRSMQYQLNGIFVFNLFFQAIFFHHFFDIYDLSNCQILYMT